MLASASSASKAVEEYVKLPTPRPLYPCIAPCHMAKWQPSAKCIILCGAELLPFGLWGKSIELQRFRVRCASVCANVCVSVLCFMANCNN